jgi:LmbE family N-acetylglucosaminyl deacetylase
MASPDHFQATQITDAAVFYSRLTKWDDAFDRLPVHTISKQLWYPLGLQSINFPEGAGQFVVDISATLAVKLEAVRAYASQFYTGKERVFRLVDGMNRMLGMSAGFEAGELFICATTLGSTDLVKTVLPGE